MTRAQNRKEIIINHAVHIALRTRDETPPDGDAHAHHWLIDSPNGTQSVHGQCKTCGTSRQFRVSEEEQGFIRKKEVTEGLNQPSLIQGGNL